jgi:hypothetical protein
MNPNDDEMQQQPTMNPPANELRSLIEKQESYIAQLEKETRFCREQLAKVLAQVQVRLKLSYFRLNS